MQQEVGELLRVMEQHAKECSHCYKDRENQLFGQRCDKAVVVFFDPKDGVFHLQEKPWRRPCCMVQNTKKSFYVEKGGALQQYFYDSYEGWYIRSYYQGFRQNYTCEASAKYRQCPEGMRLNRLGLQLTL